MLQRFSQDPMDGADWQHLPAADDLISRIKRQNKLVHATAGNLDLISVFNLAVDGLYVAKTLMKTFVHILVVIVTFALSVATAVIAWKVFDFVHFFATDALNDVREVREPVFWRDYFNYLVVYIPVLLIGFFSVICAYLSYRSFKRLDSDQSRGRSEV